MQPVPVRCHESNRPDSVGYSFQSAEDESGRHRPDSARIATGHTDTAKRARLLGFEYRRCCYRNTYHHRHRYQLYLFPRRPDISAHNLPGRCHARLHVSQSELLVFDEHDSHIRYMRLTSNDRVHIGRNCSWCGNDWRHWPSIVLRPQPLHCSWREECSDKRCSPERPYGHDANAPGSAFAGTSSRIASNTTVNAAIISGIVPTAAAGGDGSYSGGAENFPRFLENWSNATLIYYGSHGGTLSERAIDRRMGKG